MRVPLVVVMVLAGCTRASDERREPVIETVAPVAVANEKLVENVLPSIGLPPPTAGPIGTAHPTTLIAAATNARWVVACQARVDTNNDGVVEVNVGHHGDLYGDASRPYLFRGGGAGQAIDELVAVSRDERHLAIMRDGKLVVIDDTNGRETTITDADVRPDQRGHSRVAEFDADSKRLIYFRAGSTDTIVIRELATPRERSVRMPGVRAWNASAEAGPMVRFRFIREDTDKNGTLDWPTVNTNAPVGEVCTGPALSYSTYGGGGDEVREAWLDLDKGTVTENVSVLAHVGPKYDELVRSKDGSIVLEGKTLVPASCKANVVAVLPSPVRVAVVCDGAKTDDDGRSATVVDVYGPSFHAALAMRARRDFDRPPRRLTSSVFCQNADICHDLVTGKRFTTRGPMIENHGTAMLSNDEDQLYWMASPTSSPVLVPGIEGRYAHAKAGSIVALEKGIVDLATGRVLGYAPKSPLAIDLRSRVLVPSDDTGGGLPLGPLVWAEPLAQPPPD